MVNKINRSYLNVGKMYSIKGVVVHNDAGSVGATAEWYVNWLANRNKELGIAHYYIDRNTIVRLVDTYKVAYHTGDGVTTTSGNGNYIGYEVCQSMGASEADFIANENMALRQVAEDMLFYNLPVNRDTVKLHREFVPTSCPHRSWDLHGKSLNSVKDYFISKIKHYQSLGNTVEEMLAREANEIAPTAKVTVRNINQKDFSYEVVLTNIKAPNGVKEVFFPTWTNNKGQDDLVWHKGVKQANGDYTYLVKASEHKGEQGIYTTHAYIVTNSGKQFSVGGYDLYLNSQKPTGNITVTKDESNDKFTVKVTGVTNPNGVKEVRLPIWTDNKGQDDIKWYVADKQQDGSYTKTVYRKDHNNEAGKYFIHGYVLQKNAQLVGFGGTSVEFPVPKVVKVYTEIVTEKDEVNIYTLKGTKLNHIQLDEEAYAKLGK